MAKKPGDNFAFQFTTSNSSGALAAADTATATAVRNGVDDGTVTVTVTTPSAGVYKAAGTIPVGYASGDDFQVRVNVTVGGITSAALRDYGTLDGKRVSDLHDSAYAGADTAGTTTLLTAVAAINSSLSATAGLFVTGTVSSVTDAGSFTVAFGSAVAAADLVGLLCCFQGADLRPAKAEISEATQVDSTHVALQFNSPFAAAPASNDAVLVG